MIKIHRNYPLHDLNTFHVPVYTKYFCEIKSFPDITELITDEVMKNNIRLVLGVGSNILFTRDFNGIVIKNNSKGISLFSENDDHAFIEVNSGEVWHDLVLFALRKNLGGLENLSYIPGTVGAAPIQNIGAYGVEMKNTFVSLKAIDLATGEIKGFSKDDCNFGYRHSIFKNEYINRYFILSVVFKLVKNPIPNTSYRDVATELENSNITDPDINKISEVIIKIRKNKLPDPKETGNAGSFFKNPSVLPDKFQYLQKLFPGIKGYENPDETIKIPAAWLIEQCGWKGRRKGDVGTYPKQALIIVNFGSATGQEILDFASEIKKSVWEKFDVELEYEVNIL